MPVYQYLLSSLQPDTYPDQLQTEIALTFNTIQYITTDDTYIYIYFSTTLTSPEQTTLQGIVTSFVTTQPSSNQYIAPIFFRKVITTATYSPTATDCIIGVSATQTTPVTITLPLAASVINGQEYSISDEGGNAFTNNITIVPSGSDTIIGYTSIIMNMNYMSMCLYSNGSTTWFLK